ncbi:hypothetical protein LN042_11635 [Kitasatospora sp. RB6PN24]|uniref:hypothetical protein n=1 Tax=Kitasatospora humi TaxID=2893891 RepID=UPI001E50A5C8|nr:hypothetical protein [Kitasatospora humi]MCC9307741.1 hypothetical protein [Kitasatospora humi]
MKLLPLLRLLRRPTVEPWPGNPRTVADDLRVAQEHEAELAAELTAARQRADVADARTAAAGLRADDVERQLAQVRRELRAVREQLHNAMGYDDAELAAIDAGTGQPRKA